MDERTGPRPEELTAREARALIRAGEWTGPTTGLAPGYVQANLVVLPGDFAPDFGRFCRGNPRALPLLDVTEPGSPTPARIAPGSDVRLDLPRYRVYREGRMNEEPTDIVTLWRADFVAFLIGCSFTFDALLRANGVAVRHLELGRNVPMYVTDRETEPAGRFSGPLVVSMRPIRRDDVDRVVELTRGLPLAHGEPILIGSPEALGIEDLKRPDYGDAVPVRDDEVPAFWACGVTAQAAAERSRVPLMITHAPGHMFITDLTFQDMSRFEGSEDPSMSL
jgi:uncharacterized protein YcsI (UPF0317 family)